MLLGILEKFRRSPEEHYRNLTTHEGRYHNLADAIQSCVGEDLGVLTDVSLKRVLAPNAYFLHRWKEIAWDVIDKHVEAVIFCLEEPHDVSCIFIDGLSWSNEDVVSMQEICGYYGSILVGLKPQREHSALSVQLAFVNSQQQSCRSLERLVTCSVCQSPLTFSVDRYEPPTLRCDVCFKDSGDISNFAEQLHKISTTAFSRFSEVLSVMREQAYGSPMKVCSIVAGHSKRLYP